MKKGERVKIKETARTVRYEHMQEISEPDPDRGKIGVILDLYDQGEGDGPAAFAELSFPGELDEEGFERRSGLVPLANLETYKKEVTHE